MKLLLGMLAVFGILLLVLVSSNSKPTVQHDNSGWREFTVEEIGVSFSAPSDMQVRTEKLSENAYTFYVERGVYPEPNFYQLYGLYTPINTQGYNKDLIRDELVKETIKEFKINGYDTISGRYKAGEKQYTVVITSRGLLTITTTIPNQADSTITESIIQSLTIQ